MKVAIISWTPIAGAPFQQWHCLKKYGKEILPSLQVRFIQHRNRYADGREFPKDLLLHESAAKNWIRSADVIHVHNYAPKELLRLIDKKKQKVVVTLHSCPRQGTWRDALKLADRAYTIRQPMQMREYKDFPTLPNMFDVWEWAPAPKREFDIINVVYCPTNRQDLSHAASKGYMIVMPFLTMLQRRRKDVRVIHFEGVGYLENIRRKREGHIVIDDIVHDTYHLTSIEGASHAQVVMTGLNTRHGYPFMETTQQRLSDNMARLLDDRRYLYEMMKAHRAWAEQYWNPRAHCKEFIEAYQGVL
jgi:hypothetical protein